MLNMTVNGVACNPSNCLVVNPQWTFSGGVVAGGNVLDTTYSLQSVNPPGAGGTVTVVATLDAKATDLQGNIGGVDLNGSAVPSITFANGQVREQLVLTVGANGKTAGDYLGTWTTPAAPPPPTCTVGVPPDCLAPSNLPIPTLSFPAIILLLFGMGWIGGTLARRWR